MLNELVKKVDSAKNDMLELAKEQKEKSEKDIETLKKKMEDEQKQAKEEAEQLKNTIKTMQQKIDSPMQQNEPWVLAIGLVVGFATTFLLKIK
jgi:ElaB/YqjD/DUF883 family membrane-anchored ribosome-binding protein